MITWHAKMKVSAFDSIESALRVLIHLLPVLIPRVILRHGVAARLQDSALSQRYELLFVAVRCWELLVVQP